MEQNVRSNQILQKNLKPSWVFSVALGSAVGWGAFVLPYSWVESSGVLSTITGFIIGASLVSVVAICYGKAVQHLPVTGGGVVYAYASAGKIHALIAGWSLILGYIGIVALNASAVALVFRSLLPQISQTIELYEFSGWTIYLPEVLISLVFLVLFSFINIRGSKFSGAFQWFAVLMMFSSVALILISCLVLAITDNFNLAPPNSPSISLTGVMTIVAFAPWAFVGFDGVPQLGGELNFSPKKVLLLLIAAIMAATFIYIAMTLSTAISLQGIHENIDDRPWPVATAIGSLLGQLGLILLSVSVTAGVLTGLNGFFASSSRVILSMARASMLPQWFGRLDPRFGTPRNAVLFVMAVSAVTPWFGRSTLSWVVDMTSVGIAIAYFYVCLCVYKIGRYGLVPGLQSPVVKSPALAFIGLAGCAISTFFLALLLLPFSPGKLGTEALIALVVWVLLGSLLITSTSSRYRAIPPQKIVKILYGSD